MVIHSKARCSIRLKVMIGLVCAGRMFISAASPCLAQTPLPTTRVSPTIQSYGSPGSISTPSSWNGFTPAPSVIPLATARVEMSLSPDPTLDAQREQARVSHGEDLLTSRTDITLAIELNPEFARLLLRGPDELDRLRAEERFEQLVELLDSDDWRIREQGREELVRLGEAAVALIHDLDRS
ncbi:MAG: hypothetical protein J5J00_12900, partial [Deltaproteobacteria bacterium]|nr:hypothetical protein [Deltaproteobacteria bacterium]